MEKRANAVTFKGKGYSLVGPALKAGDKARLSALRLILAAIQNRDIAYRPDEAAQAAGRDKISDAEIALLLQTMIKQRREAIEVYGQGGRPDLADKEAGEIAVIEEFLPVQMSADDMKSAVAATVKEIGAAGPKDMGRTMAALKRKYSGQMDFGKASALVKDLLGTS